MASSKAALKKAKAAIDGQRWEEVVSQVETVLAADSQNYFAKLFLGRALDKLGRFDESVKAYQEAAEIKPNEDQAWQGLRSLFESRGSEHVDTYINVGRQLAEIYMQADDQHRCQSALDKVTNFVRIHGNKAQLKRAFELEVPDGPFYEYLEGRLPHPSYTYVKLAEITETEEKERIQKEIGERRTRLGARINQVTAEVKYEVYSNSSLEELYQKVIDWHLDDEIRRQYEEKLLSRAYDTLMIIPPGDKVEKLEKVKNLAYGMVILKHPFLLAWQIVLEWKELEHLRSLDISMIRDFINIFPDDGLSKTLKQFLHSPICPFEHGESKSKGLDNDPASKQSFSLVKDELENIKESALGSRVIAEYCLYVKEYSIAVGMARQGIRILHTEIAKFAVKLQSNLDSLGISLATALTYYQAPRYHYEAKSILHDILKRKPNETAALIGIGLILEEDEDYAQAVTFLSKAIESCPQDTRLKSEIAWCKASTGDNEGALKILEECLSQPQEDDVKSQEFRAQLLYRTGVCIWELDKSANARKNRSGAYRRFLSAIKLDTNLAPAYTKLGEYYEDYAKDRRRSRQCLQRAFELSAAEVEAAERLARSFANEGDWDIVEVITLRVIESGRTRPSPGSKKKGLSWPHSALGMVQLNRQDYASSIRSFLAALRISPDDYHSYVGLGENYYNSGRYNSAAKALQHAQSLESGIPTLKADDLCYTNYMLSNVYREIGDYDQAIVGYKGVLANRPEQYGVSISLLQTYVEKAWQDIDLGYFGRAARTSRDAFSVAKSLAQHRSDSFNLWKAIGDLCSTFTWLFGHIDMLPIQELRELILSVEHLDDLNIFKEFDGVDMDSVVSGEHQTQERRRRFCIYAAILAQKRALRTVLHDFHAQAVGWYNLGWSEYRAYVCFNMILKEDMKIQKKFMKAAVRCFKKAIELEASNAQFWNALGIVTTSLDAKIAQHSFVRSLHINERNAHVWTNLGTLYLLHNDLELAHLAFARAQATDPDYAHAWVGGGFLSLGRGDIKEAWMHFTHAFEISGSSSISVKQHYGVASFDYVSPTSFTSNTTDLLQPLFALQQLHAIIPNNDPTRYIAALFHERVGEFEIASTILSEICATAEAEFESSESATSLTRYAQAKVDLARNEFAIKKYQKAIESADTALDLLNDTDNCKLSNQARRNCLLSAHLTGGLANYYLKQMDRSIAMFRSALNESNSSPEVVCLLSQVLWFKGGKDERRVATDQLLHCAEKNPSNARVITLLGAIAVLTDDEDTMAAVNEDLRSLRTQPGLSTIQLKQLLQMITILADVSSNQQNKQHIVLNEVMTNIMLSPSQPYGWTELANISDDKFSASMAVRTALREAPPKGPILAVELAKAFLATNALVDAQRACMLAPWLHEIFKKFQTPTTETHTE